MMTGGDAAAHLCAVAMEYELFSASKLQVSYKASIMKRVNEIKKLTGQCRLHAALNPHTADKCTIVSDARQTLMTSAEDPSSFKDMSSSSVDSTADNDAIRLAPDIHCDKNNAALIFGAHESYLPKECGDSCDRHELRSSVQKTSVLSESVASDISANSVDGCDCQKDDLRERCKTQTHINHSHDVDYLSAVSVKSESSAADTMLHVGATANKSLKKKSVRISSSPPAVRYTDWQRKGVCNGAFSAVIKVS